MQQTGSTKPNTGHLKRIKKKKKNPQAKVIKKKEKVQIHLGMRTGPKLQNTNFFFNLNTLLFLI